MNRSNVLRPVAAIVILLLLISSWWMRKGKRIREPQATPVAGAHQQVIPANARLVYTRHARCRMDCRHITEAEVQEVLAEGVVNEVKSNPSDKPCPTYAIEDETREGQHLRIVFAPCGDVVKVVTCIDLDKEFGCHCE
jgi:hypothetical protein